jgi:hypothetical protein
MARRSRLRTGNGPENGATPMTGDVDLTNWQAIDELALPADRRALFRRRECAVRLYLEGATDNQIRAACAMGRAQAYRLLTERCL